MDTERESDHRWETAPKEQVDREAGEDDTSATPAASQTLWTAGQRMDPLPNNGDDIDALLLDQADDLTVEDDTSER